MAIPSALFIAALLMVVIGGPSAEALIIDGKTITAVNLESILYCSRDGNKPTDGPVNGVAGIPVELRCGSASGDQVLRTATTDLAGKYTFVFNLADALLFDPAKCYIAVKLPLGTCTVSFPMACSGQFLTWSSKQSVGYSTTSSDLLSSFPLPSNFPWL